MCRQSNLVSKICTQAGIIYSIHLINNKVHRILLARNQKCCSNSRTYIERKLLDLNKTNNLGGNLNMFSPLKRCQQDINYKAHFKVNILADNFDSQLLTRKNCSLKDTVNNFTNFSADRMTGYKSINQNLELGLRYFSQLVSGNHMQQITKQATSLKNLPYKTKFSFMLSQVHSFLCQEIKS